MTTYKRYKIRLISLLLVVLMPCSQMAWAAPVLTMPIPNLDRVSIDPFIANPSELDIPFEHVTLKDFHQGTNGKLIVHIQDAHANLGGQKSLSKALDHMMNRYDMDLVLVEGSARDSTLTEVRNLAPIKDWKIIASRFLFDGIISGEEYLNLTSKHPMKIRGVEYKDIYDKSIRAYAALVDKRSDILHYLHDSKTALNRLKNKFYPKSLLDFEDKYPNHKEDTNFQAKFEDILSLAVEAQVDLSTLKEVLKLKEIRKQEVDLDFAAITAEQKKLLKELENRGAKAFVKEYAKSSKVTHHNQMSQYMLISNLINMAQSKKIDLSAITQMESYQSYLAEFAQLDLDTLLNELELMEDWTYEAILTNPDAQKIRAIDRFMGLLGNAYKLQMSSKDFGLLKFNESSFETESWLALMNQKLTEVGFFESILPYKPELDNARNSLGKFYDLVSRRDVAFIDNAERIMTETDSKAAFLIAGGYHTEHLTQLLKEDDYSYLVLTPVVSHKTDHGKYEKLLLAHLDANQDILSQKIADTFMASKLAETKTPRGLRMPDLVTGGNVVYARMAARSESVAPGLAPRISKMLATLRDKYAPYFSPARREFRKKKPGLQRNLKEIDADLRAEYSKTPAIKQIHEGEYEHIDTYANAANIYPVGDNHAGARQFLVSLISQGLITHKAFKDKKTSGDGIVDPNDTGIGQVFPAFLDAEGNFNPGLLTQEVFDDIRKGIRDNSEEYVNLNPNDFIVLLGDVVDAHVVEDDALRQPGMRRKVYGSRVPNLAILEIIRDLTAAAEKRGAKVVANLGNHDDLIRRTLNTLLADEEQALNLNLSSEELLIKAKKIAHRIMDREGFSPKWYVDVDDTISEIFSDPKANPEVITNTLIPVSLKEFLPGGDKAWIVGYFNSLKPIIIVDNHVFAHHRIGTVVAEFGEPTETNKQDFRSATAMGDRSDNYADNAISETPVIRDGNGRAKKYLDEINELLIKGLSDKHSIFASTSYARDWLRDKGKEEKRVQSLLASAYVKEYGVVLDYFWFGHSVQEKGVTRVNGNNMLADTRSTPAFSGNGIESKVVQASIRSRKRLPLVETRHTVNSQISQKVEDLTEIGDGIVLKGDAAEHRRSMDAKIIEWVRVASQLKYQNLGEGELVDLFVETEPNRSSEYLLKAASSYPNASETKLYFLAYQLYREAKLVPKFDEALEHIEDFRRDLGRQDVTADEYIQAINGDLEEINSKDTLRDKYYIDQDATADPGDLPNTLPGVIIALLRAGTSRMTSVSSGDPFSQRLLLNQLTLPASRLTTDRLSEPDMAAVRKGGAAALFAARLEGFVVPLALAGGMFVSLFVSKTTVGIQDNLGGMREVAVSIELLTESPMRVFDAVQNQINASLLTGVLDAEIVTNSRHEAVAEDLSSLLTMIANREAELVSRPVVDLSHNYAIPEAFDKQVEAIVAINRILISRGIKVQAQFVVTLANGLVVDIKDERVVDSAYIGVRERILDSLTDQAGVLDYLPYSAENLEEFETDVDIHRIVALVAKADKEEEALKDLKSKFKRHGAIFISPSSVDGDQFAFVPPAAAYLLQNLLSILNLDDPDQASLLRRIFNRMTNQILTDGEFKSLQSGREVTLKLVRRSRLAQIKGVLEELSSRMRGVMNIITSA